ncbi:hypothetical protein [Caulobacter mirabilis]|uniref:Lipoprotein n=1 Tax=Caulobacter mirabilis TaxID=69666 RepID=A0A2D2AUH9_9CAUL|nr:hypothetical protein [Caulobacter mirabilis]ATQ41664.1 hypothetical protein CSW64_04175 [Caulobacter mirabilis]
MRARWKIGAGLIALLLLGGCDGVTLGAGMIIHDGGAYACYGDRPVDASDYCKPANVYLCNSGTKALKVKVESSFTTGAPETLVQTYTVQPKTFTGKGPFIGLTEHKRINGMCAVRQHLLTVLP